MSERDFYSSRSGIGDDTSASSATDGEQFEKLLSRIEGTAKPRLDELVRLGCPPSHEVRYGLSLYFALQRVRGPGFRRMFTQVRDAISPRQLVNRLTVEGLTALLNSCDRSVPEEVAQAWLSEFITNEASNNQQLLLRADPVIEIFFQMLTIQSQYYHRVWRLLAFQDARLITSDEPWAMQPLQAGGPPEHSAGAIWLPLDRQHALALTCTGTERVVSSGESRALQINQLVAERAERWIVCHPDDVDWVPIDPGPPLGTHVETHFEGGSGRVWMTPARSSPPQ